MNEVERLQQNANRATVLLKAMSNPHRLLILCQLLDSEKSVGELERIVGLSQSALSQHLARLRGHGLVRTRRSAQTIYYTLHSPQARQLINHLYEMFCGEQQAPAE